MESFVLHSPIYFALTTFEQELNSGEVYATYDKLTHGCSNEAKYLQHTPSNEHILKLLQQGDNERAIALFSNGLQSAATAIRDYAEQYLHFAKANGLNPVMTGSGSAYYIAFTNLTAAEEAVKLLNSRGFNSLLCQSLPQGIEIIE